MDFQKCHDIFTRFRESNPDPRTELNYSNNFQLLVAVVLSAQATDKSVNQATKQLFKVAPNPQSMQELGLENLKKHIRSIGLFNTKAKNILNICRILLEKHDGRVPNDRKSLESLPGVGRKTANVILNTAFGEPTIAVDTHIFRVSNRTGLAPGKNVLEVEKNLLESVPKEFHVDAHHWLILHGRYTCIARKPKCNECKIFDLCEFTDKTEFMQNTASKTTE